MLHTNLDIYATVWTKYLPIIRILLKKSLTNEQVLSLNAPDFERVGMTRKSGYKFRIVLKNGKSDNVIVDLPAAAALVSVLLQDKVIKQLSTDNEFHITLNTAYQLTIKHFPGEPVEKEQHQGNDTAEV